MREFNQNNSTMRFCIDSVCDGNISGRVFSRRFTRAVGFTDLVTLILQLDKVFDRQGFPQAFQRARTFLRNETELDYISDDPAHGVAGEYVLAQRGNVLTFDVTVISRRNANWQGIICWVDSSEQQKFSGIMDLLRLIRQNLPEHSL